MYTSSIGVFFELGFITYAKISMRKSKLNKIYWIEQNFTKFVCATFVRFAR